MGCFPAPACIAARKEASALWPGRSVASDGICASEDHLRRAPVSDHNTGDAVDITHNPGSGADCNVMAARIVARKDPRVKYLIFNKRILRSYDKPGIPAWTWAPYSGANDHTKHLHISIKPGARNDIAPWFAPIDEAPEDDMFSDQDRDRLARVEAMLQRVNYETATPDGNLAKAVVYARTAATRTSGQVDVAALATALRDDLGEQVAADLAKRLSQ